MHFRSRWLTFVIITSTVALVAGPVLVPREIARWYLAAAANSYHRGDQVLGEHYLSRAVAWDEEIRDDTDYSIAQLQKNDPRTPDEWLDLLEKVIQEDRRWARSALDARKMFAEAQDFQRAVRALKMVFVDGQPRTADGLNELAYFRSLAGIELEEALTDIDRAIELEGRKAGILDTKAWVLHAMDRNEDALALINDAIKRMEEEMKSARITVPEALASSAKRSAELAQRSKPASSSLADTQRSIQAAKERFGIEAWSYVVLRFHRLRILESLKLDADTHEDRRWLTERGVPIVDELF